MNLINTIKQIIKEEVTGPNYLFTKEYVSEDKSIIASYYIMEEGENVYRVANPMQYIDKDSVYADGYRPYRLKINEFNLPKSQVEIMGEVDGYTIFKIPYWLFKKNNDMNIIRMSDSNKRYKNYNDDVLFQKYDEQTITNILKPLGGDIDKIGMTYRVIQSRKDIESPQD